MNLFPKLHMLPIFFGLFGHLQSVHSLLKRRKIKKTNRPLLELPGNQLLTPFPSRRTLMGEPPGILPMWSLNGIIMDTKCNNICTIPQLHRSLTDHVDAAN